MSTTDLTEYVVIVYVDPDHEMLMIRRTDKSQPDYREEASFPGREIQNPTGQNVPGNDCHQFRIAQVRKVFREQTGFDIVDERSIEFARSFYLTPQTSHAVLVWSIFGQDRVVDLLKCHTPPNGYRLTHYGINELLSKIHHGVFQCATTVHTVMILVQWLGYRYLKLERDQ